MAEGALRIAYVVTRFLQPPETFAATDIRALRRAGSVVTVHSLRTTPRGVADRAVEWGVADEPRTYNSIRASARGLLYALRHPLISLGLVALIVRDTYRQPIHFVKSLVLVPRVLDVVRALEEWRPDVVHAFWGHYPALVLHTLQRILPETVRSMFVGAYDLVMDYGPTASIAREADSVWTHAEANLSHLEGMGLEEDRIHVVHRGIEVEQIPAVDAAARAPYHVLTAGRLIPGKQFEAVLDAFRVVRNAWPDATLDVFGGGPSLRALVARAKRLGIDSAVAFRGMAPHRQVLAAMARARVLVLLSTKPGERLPNVVKEAMAAGAFVVVARTPGIEELIRSPEHGVIVPPSDVAAAADAISACFSAAPDAAREQRARRFVELHFSSRSQMALYVESWRSDVERRRSVRVPNTLSERQLS